MQHMSARDAKNGFGRLIDLARAEPVAIEKYGRPVVIVLAIEEYKRLLVKAGAQRSVSRSAKPEGTKQVIKKEKRRGRPAKKVT